MPNKIPMLFQILVILHTLGATVWVGGHLILAVSVLPKALKQQEPALIQDFESNFESFGLAALLLQVITGLGLAWIYIPNLKTFLQFDGYLSTYIAIKLGLLLLTLGLAIHARIFIIPKLTKETLNSLAYHIMGITILAVVFVIMGAGIRVGGFVLE